MGSRGAELIEQAQRVAEGVMLRLHSTRGATTSW